jgi:hypothetical protein
MIDFEKLYKPFFHKYRFFWRGYNVDNNKTLVDQNVIAYHFRIIKGDCYVNGVYLNEAAGRGLQVLEWNNANNEEFTGQIEIRKAQSETFMLNVAEKFYRAG